MFSHNGRTADTLAAPSSWYDFAHDDAVTNEEGFEDLTVDGVTIGALRPWWGSFQVYRVAGSSEGVAYDVGPSRVHFWTYIDQDGFLHLARSGNIVPLAPASLKTTIKPVYASIEQRHWDGALFLVTQEVPASDPGVDHVLWRVSKDEGVTWTVAVDLGPGKRGDICAGWSNDLLVYWIEGTAIKGAVLDPVGNTIVSEFTAIASDVDEDTIRVRETTLANGRRIVVLMYRKVSTGHITITYSVDGQTFT